MVSGSGDALVSCLIARWNGKNRMGSSIKFGSRGN